LGSPDYFWYVLCTFSYLAMVQYIMRFLSVLDMSWYCWCQKNSYDLGFQTTILRYSVLFAWAFSRVAVTFQVVSTVPVNTPYELNSCGGQRLQLKAAANTYQWDNGYTVHGKLKICDGFSLQFKHLSIFVWWIAAFHGSIKHWSNWTRLLMDMD